MKRFLTILIISLTSLNVSKARPLINQLKTGDTLVITMVSKGCFHFSIDSLLITKTPNSYKAIFEGSTAILQPKELRAIRRFERSKIINQGICTTTKTYVTSLREKTRYKKDRSCTNWRGYEKLLDQLGFSES